MNHITELWYSKSRICRSIHQRLSIPFHVITRFNTMVAPLTRAKKCINNSPFPYLHGRRQISATNSISNSSHASPFPWLQALIALFTLSKLALGSPYDAQLSNAVQNLRLVSICSILSISLLLFLYSPSLPSLHAPSPKAPPVWLIATISPAHSQQRRNIIRATWQSLYDDPAITTRFVISDPGELWMPLIRHENATYGDLIILSHLEETAHIANTIKTVELFRYLVESGFHWDFVSKLDDDSFLDVFTFYHSFILPRLDTRSHNRIIIGRRLSRQEPILNTPVVSSILLPGR